MKRVWVLLLALIFLLTALPIGAVSAAEGVANPGVIEINPTPNIQQPVQVQPNTTYTLSISAAYISYGPGLVCFSAYNPTDGSVLHTFAMAFYSKTVEEQTAVFTTAEDETAFCLILSANRADIQSVTLTPAEESVARSGMPWNANGDFETGDFTGWNAAESGVYITEDAYTGNYAAYMWADDNSPRLSLRVGAAHGKTYVVHLWVKVTSRYLTITPIGGHKLQAVSVNDSEWTCHTYRLTASSYAQGSVATIGIDIGGNGSGYIDNVAIIPVEETPMHDETITNGDFETGTDEDWYVWKSDQNYVVDTAAYEGEYGMHLKSDGDWDALIERSVAVEPGETYRVSLWVRVHQNGVNIAVADGTSNENLSGEWVDDLHHSQWTNVQWEFVAIGPLVRLYVCGPGNEQEAIVDLDAVTVTRVDHTHAYDNTCDTICAICGWVRAITHTYEDDCDTT